ncbi:hypothetical protein [Lignipirellula cremea]|uniref:Uncharacterized protein n=1 Tax=Lignipirellula cremea TaxID=2528010 RepID=A0A518DLH9_9BACT|nr:hypothetical protein [Lignipirellula cremea]QDU92698.1 hypothetical protein Pla8534_04460 [Lignipirellula cremea]
MSDKDQQPISAEQAAGLLFRTRSPDFRQIGRVNELMRRGDLKQSDQRQFTTTRRAVAEYLSSEMLRKQEASRTRQRALTEEIAAGRVPAPRRRSASKIGRGRQTSSPQASQNNPELKRVYRQVLNDYFLSVITVGRRSDHSAGNPSLAIAIRAGMLLGAMALAAWGLRGSVAQNLRPEHGWQAAGVERVRDAPPRVKKIVQDWIRVNRAQGELLDLLPATQRPGGKAVRVRLRFQHEQETRYEDSIFVLAGKEVLLHELPTQADKGLAPGPL